MRSERLPLSVANCPIPINITSPITTSIKSDFEKITVKFQLSLFFLDLIHCLIFYSISYIWYSPIAVGTVLIVWTYCFLI